MKLMLILILMASILGFTRDDSLRGSIIPKLYRPREDAVFKIALAYYGDYYSQDDLQRVGNLLTQRFYESTDKALKLEIVHMALMPFKTNILDFPTYQSGSITEITRLQRVWYYDNVNMGIMREVYEQALITPPLSSVFDEIDAFAVVTGAQFDGLGLASGRVAVTENPREIAWGGEDGGWVEIQSDAKVVDELIHELGHTLYLGHSATQCHIPGMSNKESTACCEQSPGKNDVMGYCRERSKVDDIKFYKFETCSLKKLKEIIIPSLLSGGAWEIEASEICP